MSDAGSTTPPALPPRPAVSIGYESDATAGDTWASLLKWTAAVSAIVAFAGIGTALVDLLPLVGFPRAVGYSPVAVTFTLMRLVPMILLLAGAIGALSGREFGRKLLVGYAFTAIAASFVYLVMTQVTSTRSRPLDLGLHFFMRMTLSSLQSVGMPLLVLGIVRQPRVKRLFGRK